MQSFYRSSLMALALFVLPVFSGALEKAQLYGNYTVENSDGDKFDAEINENGIRIKRGSGYTLVNIFNGGWGDFLLSRIIGPYIDTGKSGKLEDCTEFTISLKNLSIEDLQAEKPSYVEATLRSYREEEKIIKYTIIKLPRG